MITGNPMLILGITFGILFTFFGIIIAIASLPMAKGVPGSWKNNYRPVQPKFIKDLSSEEHDKYSQTGGKLGIVLSIFMVVSGLCALFFGATSIMNPLIIAYVFIIVAIIIILAGYAYGYVFWRKTHKAK